MANTAVFGIFNTRQSVEQAVDALSQAKFRDGDISVLLPSNPAGTRDFATEKHSKAPEGAVVGAAAGALLFGVLGWMIGAGMLAVPGNSLLVAAGPIVAALAGAGAGGILGAIAGALAGMSIPEYEARRYAGRLKEGGILLSVHTESKEWVSRAKQILKAAGAHDIAAASESTIH